jgi:hypothetical protein
METTTHEIADGVYRFSTYIPDMDFMFNQFVVKGEEALLFHCGPRQLFPWSRTRSHARSRSTRSAG